MALRSIHEFLYRYTTNRRSCALYNPRIFFYRVDGKNLLPYLIAKQEAADKARSKPKLSEKDIASLTKQLLMALQYLHQQGIAYLDIKVIFFILDCFVSSKLFFLEDQ